MTPESNTKCAAKPAHLKLNFYSHATLECRDIASTRRFFEEFLGFETVQMADASFWARLGGDQVIVVVQGPRRTSERAMQVLNHNGLDVSTESEVDAAHEIVTREAEHWGLKKISKPAVQHGTYSFYFWDGDGNAWEILANPQGGYAWGFGRGDQSGAGHTSRSFARPESTLTKARNDAT
jgi:catechol 2,3-dioxygenase-like lactoylglutathione lyase family enzyme